MCVCVRVCAFGASCLCHLLTSLPLSLTNLAKIPSHLLQHTPTHSLSPPALSLLSHTHTHTYTRARIHTLAQTDTNKLKETLALFSGTHSLSHTHIHTRLFSISSSLPMRRRLAES